MGLSFTICKQGPSNFCRAVSVWKGNKDKEDQDRKWAEEKLRLLRAERNALKEGFPSNARKHNYNLKLHEKARPVPDAKRKELEKTESSPHHPKFLKITSSASVDPKLSLTVGGPD